MPFYFMLLFEVISLFSGRWVPVGEVDADQTSLMVDGLAEGKKYKFRVRAANAEGESEPLESEEPVVAKNPYTVPNPPQVSCFHSCYA